MQLIMETLTPIQVGSGEELLRDLDYIQHDGAPMVVDQNRCFEALAAQGAATTASTAKTLTSAMQQLDQLYGYPLHALHGGACNPQQIREQLKDAQWRPLVPGSSLKGAIRTALLAEKIREVGVEKRNLPFFDNRKKKAAPGKGSAGQKVSKSVFGNDPKNDWIRAWKIGDTAFVQDDLCLADVRFLNLAPDLKWKNMAGRNSVADWRQATGVHVEALAPGVVAAVQIHVDEFLLHGTQVARQLRWQHVPDSYDALRAILNRHAAHRLHREVEFYGQHGCQEALNSCIQLMQIMEQEEHAIYLQMGWGSGWRGMTGDWQHDAGIEADMRALYNLGKKGTDEFPKTRRLAVFDGSPSLPFGWLRLWQAEDCPALQQQAEERAGDQAARISQRNSAMQSIQAEQECKRQEAEAHRLHLQAEAEEKARVKAAEEARKAAMTPFDREMETILLNEDAAIGELMKGLESGQWEGDDARVAAEHLKRLMTEHGSWLPEFTGSNKFKKKKHGRTLKVMCYLSGSDL